MYESPINIFNLPSKIVRKNNELTEELVMELVHNVKVEVDKDELIKALTYDRKQYEKGFMNGYDQALDEFCDKLCSNGMLEDFVKDYIRENAEELKEKIEYERN